MKKIARILSIDGGGIRGLIPATILAGWEKELSARISDKFHMIAGTSTGGILACGLSRPGSVLSAHELQSFYHQKGPDIFKSPTGSLGGLIDERYSSESLEKVLADLLHGRLSEIEVCDLLSTSYDIERRTPFIFKSWRAQGVENSKKDSASYDFELKGVARATSAAPTYFKPARIQNQTKDPFALIDGGVFANNPAMCAYVAARRLYPLADEFVVVSLGTGQTSTPYLYDDASTWGFVGWARPLLDILFSGVSDTVSYELDQLAPGVSHYRYQSSLSGASEDMDDVSETNLNALVHVGQRSAVDNRKSMRAMLARLSEPKIDRKLLGYPGESPSQLIPKVASVVRPQSKSEAGGMAVGAIAGGAVGSVFGPLGTLVGAGLGALGVKLVPEEKS